MAKVDKQEQIQELLKRAEDGARAVFESDNYRNYLSTMSKFHNYSFRNSLLIYLQKPQASYVAGYVAWQKNFSRQVQKGEKGIQIVGYTPKNVTQQQERKDAQGNIVLGTDGRPETETVTRKVPYFTPMYVYDISQTEGEPLPRLVNELDGSVEAYQDLMTALREVSPFPIVFEDIQGGANGYCSPTEQKIAIRQGMGEAQTVKTTIHEMTHADLHAPEIAFALSERKDRRTKEVEAESTAFVVCNHYGIDSSDYTFGYLAAWSSTKELKELQSSLETIQTQANELIDRIDKRLAELQINRSAEITNPEVPDNSVTVEEMQQYGYTDNAMLPLDAARAIELFNENNPVYLLYSDNIKTAAVTVEDIKSHTEKGGLCGIETGDFSNSRAELTKRYDDIVYNAEAKALGISIDAYAKNDFDAPAERTFTIYQMKSGDETRDFRFEGLDRLEQQGIAPSLSMYDKAYEGVLPATATLSNIFEQFNIDRPADFTGHSLSVSDIIVVEYKGDITANYIDKYGFEALPDFAAQHQTFTEKQQPPIVGEISFASGEEDNPHNIDHYAESIKHDNDIDLDREKTREQLGFRDTPEKMSMAERFAAAKAEAARRNGEKDRQHPEQTKNEREEI